MIDTKSTIDQIENYILDSESLDELAERIQESFDIARAHEWAGNDAAEEHSDMWDRIGDRLPVYGPDPSDSLGMASWDTTRYLSSEDMQLHNIAGTWAEKYFNPEEA